MAALRNGIKNFRRNSSNSQVLRSYIVPTPPIELNRVRLNDLNECNYEGIKYRKNLSGVYRYADIDGGKRKRRSKSSPPKQRWFADEHGLASVGRVYTPSDDAFIEAEKYGRRGINFSIKSAAKKLEGILSLKKGGMKSQNLINQLKKSTTTTVQHCIRTITSLPSLQNSSVVPVDSTVNGRKTLHVIEHEHRSTRTDKSVPISETEKNNDISYIKKLGRLKVKKTDSKISSKRTTRTKSRIMSVKQKFKDHGGGFSATIMSSHSTFMHAKKKCSGNNIVNIINFANDKKNYLDTSQFLLNYTQKRNFHECKDRFGVEIIKDGGICKNGADNYSPLKDNKDKGEGSEITNKNKKRTCKELLKNERVDPEGRYDLKYPQQFLDLFIRRSKVYYSSGEKPAGLRNVFSDSNLNECRRFPGARFIASNGDNKSVSLPSLHVAKGGANLTSQHYSTSSFPPSSSTFLNDKSPTTKGYSTNTNTANTNSNQGIPDQVLHSVLMTYLHDSTKDLGLHRNNRNNILQTSFELILNGPGKDMNLNKICVKDDLGKSSLLENVSSAIGKNKEKDKIFLTQNYFFIDGPSSKGINDKSNEEFHVSRKDCEKGNNVEDKNLKITVEDVVTEGADEMEMLDRDDYCKKYRTDEISNILIGKNSKENCTAPKVVSCDPFTQRMADRLLRDHHNIESLDECKIPDEISKKNFVPLVKCNKHHYWALDSGGNNDDDNKFTDSNESLEKGLDKEVDGQTLQVPNNNNYDSIACKTQIRINSDEECLNKSNHFPVLNGKKIAREYAQKLIYNNEYTYVIGSRYLNIQNTKGAFNEVAVFDKNLRKQRSIKVSNNKNGVYKEPIVVKKSVGLNIPNILMADNRKPIPTTMGLSQNKNSAADTPGHVNVIDANENPQIKSTDLNKEVPLREMNAFFGYSDSFSSGSDASNKYSCTKKGDPEIEGICSDKTTTVELHDELSDVKCNGNVENKAIKYERHSQSILDVNISVNITSSLGNKNLPSEKRTETNAKYLKPSSFYSRTDTLKTVMEQTEGEKYSQSIIQVNEKPTPYRYATPAAKSQNNAAEINDVEKDNKNASNNLVIQNEIIEKSLRTINVKTNSNNIISPNLSIYEEENNIEIRKYFSKSSVRYFNNKYSTFDVNTIEGGDSANPKECFLNSLKKDPSWMMLQDSKLEKEGKFIETNLDQSGNTSDNNSDNKTHQVKLEITDKDVEKFWPNAGVTGPGSEVRNPNKSKYNNTISEDDCKQKDHKGLLKGDAAESNIPNENSWSGETLNAVTTPETNKKCLSQKLLEEKINRRTLHEKMKKSTENERSKLFSIKNQSSTPYKQFISHVLENNEAESSMRWNFRTETDPITYSEDRKNYDSARVSERKILQDSVKLEKIKYENKDQQTYDDDGAATKCEDKPTTTGSIVPLEMIAAPYAGLSMQRELTAKTDKLSSLLLLSETTRKLISTLKSKTKIQTSYPEADIYRQYFTAKDIKSDDNKTEIRSSNSVVLAITNTSRDLGSRYNRKKGNKSVLYQFQGTKEYSNKIKTNVDVKAENSSLNQYDKKRLLKHDENNIDYFKETRLKETEIRSLKEEKEKDNSSVNVRRLSNSDDTFKREDATGLRFTPDVLNGIKNTKATNKLRDFTSKTLNLSKGQASSRNDKPSYDYNPMAETFQNLKDKIKSDILEKELKRTRESAVKDLSQYDFSIKISRAEDLFGAKMKPTFRYYTVPFPENAAVKRQENNKQLAFSRFHSNVKEKTFNQYNMKRFSTDYRLNYNFSVANSFNENDRKNTPIEDTNDNVPVNDIKKFGNKMGGKDFNEKTTLRSNDSINDETMFHENTTTRNRSFTYTLTDKKSRNVDAESNKNIIITPINKNFIDKINRTNPKSDELLLNKINLSPRNKNVDDQLSRPTIKSGRMRNTKNDKEPVVESTVEKGSMASFINNLKDKTYKFLSSTNIVEHFTKNLDEPYKVERYQIKLKMENDVKNDKERENTLKDGTQTLVDARQSRNENKDSAEQERSGDNEWSENYPSLNNGSSTGIGLTGGNAKYFPDKISGNQSSNKVGKGLLKRETLKNNQDFTIKINNSFKLPLKKPEITDYSSGYLDKSKNNEEAFKDRKVLVARKKVEFWATKNEIELIKIERDSTNLTNGIKSSTPTDYHSDNTDRFDENGNSRPNKKNGKIGTKSKIPSPTNKGNHKNYSKNNTNNFHSRSKGNRPNNKLKILSDVKPTKRGSDTALTKKEEKASTRTDLNYSTTATGAYDGKLPQKDVMKHFTMRNEETLPLMTSQMQRHLSLIHAIPPSRSLTTRSGSNKFIPAKHRNSIFESKLIFKPSPKLHPTLKKTKTKIIYDLYRNNKTVNDFKTDWIKFEKRIHTKNKPNLLRLTPKTVDGIKKDFNIFRQHVKRSQEDVNYNFLYNGTGNGDGADNWNKNILSYLYKDRKIKSSAMMKKRKNYFAAKLERTMLSKSSLSAECRSSKGGKESAGASSASSFKYPTEDYMNRKHKYSLQRSNTNENIQPISLQRQRQYATTISN